MATENKRTVSYLPPAYHEKVREYMKQHSLTESAAIIRMVKQFFDGPELPQSSPEVERLQSEMAQVQQRLSLLEAMVANLQATPTRSEPDRRRGQSYPSPHSVPQLPPQTAEALSKRLGVSPGRIEEESAKGDKHFKDWSKQRDPSNKAWQKRGKLFHVLAD